MLSHEDIAGYECDCPMGDLASHAWECSQPRVLALAAHGFMLLQCMSKGALSEHSACPRVPRNTVHVHECPPRVPECPRNTVHVHECPPRVPECPRNTVHVHGCPPRVPECPRNTVYVHGCPVSASARTTQRAMAISPFDVRAEAGKQARRHHTRRLLTFNGTSVQGCSLLLGAGLSVRHVPRRFDERTHVYPFSFPQFSPGCGCIERVIRTSTGTMHSAIFTVQTRSRACSPARPRLFN